MIDIIGTIILLYVLYLVLHIKKYKSPKGYKLITPFDKGMKPCERLVNAGIEFAIGIPVVKKVDGNKNERR